MIYIFAVIVIGVILIGKAAEHRRRIAASQQQVCPTCSTLNPAFAQYCRRCGRRIE